MRGNGAFNGMPTFPPDAPVSVFSVETDFSSSNFFKGIILHHPLISI